jgi:hypothetical protein
MERKTDFLTDFVVANALDRDMKGGCPILGGREGQINDVDGHKILNGPLWATIFWAVMENNMLTNAEGSGWLFGLRDMGKAVQERDRMSP